MCTTEAKKQKTRGGVRHGGTRFENRLIHTRREVDIEARCQSSSNRKNIGRRQWSLYGLCLLVGPTVATIIEGSARRGVGEIKQVKISSDGPDESFQLLLCRRLDITCQGL